MADYTYDIDINDYLYKREFTVTENSGADRTDVTVLLKLDSSNFNFDLATTDGRDIRISESGGGSLILNSWVSKWSKLNEVGYVWFKIPNLYANEIKSLYLIWGNESPPAGGAETKYPLVSSDDGHSYYALGNKFYNNLDYILLGNIGSAGWHSFKCFFRFPNVPILQGATINSAYLRVTCKTTRSDNFYVDIYGNDVGDAVAPLSKLSVDALVLTTAKIDWDEPSFSWTGGQKYDSPDITSIVQEIVNRSDWSSGNAMQFVLIDTTTPSTSDYVHVSAINYDSGSQKIELWIDWGDLDDLEAGPDEVGLLFADPFADGNYDVAKWSGNSTVGNPFSGIANWKTYIGAPPSWPGDIDFYGTENDFYFAFDDIDASGADDVEHDFVTGTPTNYLGIGFDNSDRAHTIELGYYEPTDYLYYELTGRRATYGDVSESWESETHGDIRLTQLHLDNMSVEWVAIQEWSGPENEALIDSSNLYISYENQIPQNLDFNAYTINYANAVYRHTAEYGDPYKLVDEQYDSTEYVWSVNEEHAMPTSVYINFAVKGSNLVSTAFNHFDSGHEEFLNASKLSVYDETTTSGYYWQGTTTSGYAAIDFLNSSYRVGIILFRGLEDDLDGMPNNFTIDGTDSDPRFTSVSGFTNLYTGNLEKNSEWQTVRFVNNYPYRYYRIYVIDTYGNDIALRDWEMYSYEEGLSEKNIRQLRLKPANFDSNEIYFPKYINLFGVTLSGTTTEIVSIQKTYNPFEEGAWEYWQRYSFDNSNSYWGYKLDVYGNWSTEVEISDDFTGTDGDLPDTDLWLRQGVGASIITIQNNKANFDLSSSAASLALIPRVFKDFDVQVDFDIVTGPSTNSWGAGLQLFSDRTDDINPILFEDDFSSGSGKWTILEGTPTFNGSNVRLDANERIQSYSSFSTANECTTTFRMYLGARGNIRTPYLVYPLYINSSNYLQIRYFAALSTPGNYFVRVDRKVSGSNTVLHTNTKYNYFNDYQTWYWVKVYRNGNDGKFKIWKHGTSEPSSWDYESGSMWTGLGTTGRVYADSDALLGLNYLDDVEVRLSNSGTTNQFMQIYHGYSGSVRRYVFSRREDNIWSTVATYNISHSSGKLRFVRSGETFTAYYWRNGQWDELGSHYWDPTGYIDFHDVTQIKLASSKWTAPPSVEINMDNFIVNSSEGTIYSPLMIGEWEMRERV